ncbi:MAG TPA: ParB/RepB/Spo0J family partition protein [Candidatus Aminicenantes bacterium]|nr:ParB/RepB/Spo0J family partition protein [Candidatus Aminicenantes bacterium]
MKRTALGKGLNAIIAGEAPEGAKQTELDVDAVFPNPFQPRKVFDQEKLQELAESMRESGMIQPVVVFRRDSRYYLVVGERRWRAAQLLKWPKIPAYVREYSEREVMICSLIENIQREDLGAIEVAEGIAALIEKTGLTQQDAAVKMGMGRTSVTNFLRLLKLPAAVKTLVSSGSLDAGHARALLALPSEAEMISAADAIVKKSLSVRQAEELVKHNQRVPPEPVAADPDLVKMEHRLTKALAAKVSLKYTKAGKGRVTIFFDDLREFERLYTLMVRE